jgi:hypothetical protein
MTAEPDLVLSLEAAASGLGEDLAAGLPLNEGNLQRRFHAALTENTAGAVERERHVDVPGFQGVGPVDIVISDVSGKPSGLIECKWSVDLKRDKIYEGAWDAIKLALGAARHDAIAWLVTGAPEDSWRRTETPDLFADGEVDSASVWARPLYARGPNGGMTVGEDCEAGGRGNMFTHAPETLLVKDIADVAVPGSDVRIRAARISGDGSMIRFGPDPEFPSSINQRWLGTHVPDMSPAQFDRLLARLLLKRWTKAEIDSRVRPLRKDDR